MDRSDTSMLLLGCLALFLLSLPLAVAAEEKAPTVYGDGVTASKVVPIARLLDHPDDYVDQTVRVEGKITDVCPKMGCWIDIEDEKAKRSVRFKVIDGVIEFPVETKGQQVVAQGVFKRIEMTEEQALRWAEHLAEERGETFDPETAEIATTIYRIDGTGATIR